MSTPKTQAQRMLDTAAQHAKQANALSNTDQAEAINQFREAYTNAVLAYAGEAGFHVLTQDKLRTAELEIQSLKHRIANPPRGPIRYVCKNGQA